jgi:hypothetical protein
MSSRLQAVAAPVILSMFLIATVAVARSPRTLPAEVESAVRRAFPEATIRSFGRERENGALYYEVNLRQAGKRMEVEVSPEGVIGEIESRVYMEDLPAEMRSRIAKLTRGMRIRRIELHERRGRVKAGRFVPLAKTTIKYEVKYFDGRRNRSMMVPFQQDIKLPRAAAAAIAEEFPEARIIKTVRQT